MKLTFVWQAISFSTLLLFATAVFAENKSSSDWIVDKNPLGFSVKHPKGWTVKADDEGVIRIKKSDASAWVAVAPFMQKESRTSLETLSKLSDVFKSDFPKSKLLKFSQIREKPDEAIGTYSFQAGKNQGKANVFCSLDGPSGMLYAVAAPADRFDAEKETLIAIVKSFVFTEPTAKPKERKTGSTLKYVRWEDPKEKAFSLEVPEGWSVSGGLFRFASVDVRSCVELISPDETIRITGGDSEIPTFSLPMSAFFPEGSWYSPGYGVNMLVSHYLTGQEFAKEYVQKRKNTLVSNIQITESKNRADVAQTLNALNYSPNVGGITSSLTAGEVAFTGQMEGQNVVGYYFAATTKITYPAGMSEGGIWHVPYLHGFIAPEEKADLAREVLNHGIQTVALNPQWLAMQQGITAETSKIVSRTNETISNVISETYQNRQASEDNISRKWSNMMLGQTDLVDPESGETFQFASGHNYYWRKEYTNEVVGTNTYDRPDIDFTPLQEW